MRIYIIETKKKISVFTLPYLGADGKEIPLSINMDDEGFISFGVTIEVTSEEKQDIINNILGIDSSEEGFNVTKVTCPIKIPLDYDDNDNKASINRMIENFKKVNFANIIIEDLDFGGKAKGVAITFK